MKLRWHSEYFVPRHAKQYARISETIKSAVAEYVAEVSSGEFPGYDHSSSIDEAILADLT